MRTTPSSRHVYAFHPDLSPVNVIHPGDSVRSDTLDAMRGQVRAESDILAGFDFSRVNPTSGAVRIEGVVPGGMRTVRVSTIDLEDQGAIVTGPGLGVLGSEIANHATT